MRVAKDKAVTVNYTLKDENGQVMERLERADTPDVRPWGGHD